MIVEVTLFKTKVLSLVRVRTFSLKALGTFLKELDNYIYIDQGISNINISIQEIWGLFTLSHLI